MASQELKNELKLIINVLTRNGNSNFESEYETKMVVKDSVNFLLSSVHLKKDSYTKDKFIKMLEKIKNDPEIEASDKEDIDYYIEQINSLE